MHVPGTSWDTEHAPCTIGVRPLSGRPQRSRQLERARGGPSVDAATSAAPLEAAPDVACRGVLAQEAGREGVARPVVSATCGVRVPGRRCRPGRPSARRPAGPSVTTNSRSLSAATRSSSSISAASLELQPEQPDVELGSPARGERDGVADVVGVREVDRAQALPACRPCTDSKNARPCPNAAVASTSLPAITPRCCSLTRKPASTPPRSARRRARRRRRVTDVLHGRRPGTTSRQALTPVARERRRARRPARRRRRPARPRVTEAPGRTAGGGGLRRSARCRRRARAVVVVAIDPAIGRADEPHARAAVSAATWSGVARALGHEARPDDRAVG